MLDCAGTLYDPVSTTQIFLRGTPMGRLQRINFFFVILAALCAFTPLAACGSSLGSLNFVKGGKSEYSIVLPESPSEVEKFAAVELQRYIRQISGAILPIDDVAAPHSVFIGISFAKRYGINMSREKLGFDGYVIRSLGDSLVLAGREERGTLYAVYSFLEKIGCRWYAPNFDFYGKWGGQYVPKMSTIILPALDIVRKPDYAYRKEYVEEGWTHTVTADKELIDWIAKIGMNTLVYPLNYDGRGMVVWNKVRNSLIPELKKRGILVEVGGHGYQNFLPASKYFAQHPDWFGSWNGKRSATANVVFNTSNKAAVHQFTENIISYLKGHPEISIFDLWPPDGAEWSNDSANLCLGSPSDRQAILLNQVVPVIQKACPGVKVEFIAYAQYQNPPQDVRIEPKDLLMDFCPGGRSFAYPIWDKNVPTNATYESSLKKWFTRGAYKGQIGWYSYYTKYIWRSLPVVIPHLIQKEMRYLHSLGVVGIGCFSEPGNWFTYELNHYTIAEASWNSSVNVDSLIQDYARTEFGPAMKPVIRYFGIMEKTVPFANRIQGTPPATFGEMQGYMRNFDTCNALLKRGISLAGGDVKADFLIHKLQLSLQYATLDLGIREEGISLANRNMNDPDAQIKNLVDDYKTMSQLFDDNLNEGVFIRRNGYYPKW